MYIFINDNPLKKTGAIYLEKCTLLYMNYSQKHGESFLLRVSVQEVCGADGMTWNIANVMSLAL